ncbi:sigma 54-interacting transcriptional regulator [Oceanimonas sp. CHS3-5]|uniref:sigma 54-interacting transcriptional regulator n=1 Tax=Oceanimonas sp. CHS3-5 TaxID=3068186 RepID=UPI00273EEB9C|nr:sigma 54-interacting transcriptional regulator [Oceanimonas sp. CHS3-5]MDP5293661.1 sigma 54-interacting transcriptional regulator [Oceanimonas sp. CHS3-5]
MKRKARILLVDDDASLLKLLGLRLRSEGFEVATATSGAEALEWLEQERPDLVLSDLKMDGMDGLALFDRIQRQHVGLPVVIMTAHGSITDAVSATRSGVFGFLTKPIDKEALRRTINEALAVSLPAFEDDWQHDMLTRSPAMTGVLEQARRIAPLDISVLITGPAGAGKELMARTLHQASPRRDHPFMVLSCGALTEPLLESELFGHVKGAFDGAVSDHAGALVTAAGGTLLLEEVDELPPRLQARLLGVLEQQEVRPQGGSHSIKTDVRVLSATSRDMVEAMEQGRFREDLFYRLNVVNLALPALKERPEDIPLLARHFLEQIRKRQTTQVTGFAPEALALLAAAQWPGNVRELLNLVEQAVAMASAPVIGVQLVETLLSGSDEQFPTFNEARAEFERMYLNKVLRMTEGNVTQAASLAGRNRTDFYKLLSRHGIEAGAFKRKED